MQRPTNESTFSLTKKLPSCNVDSDLIQRIEDLAASIPVFQDENAGGTPDKLEITIAARDEEEKLATINHYSRSYFRDDIKRIVVTVGDWRNRAKIQLDRDPFFSTIDIRCQSSNARSDAMLIYDRIMDIVKDYRNRNGLLHPPAPLMHMILAPLSYLAFYTAFILLYKHLFVLSSRAAFAGIAIQIYTNAHRIKPYTEFKTRLNEERSRWFNWSVLATLEFMLVTYALTPVTSFLVSK